MIGRKCIHCKKQRKYHDPNDMACPIGKRSREVGYAGYSTESRFEAKEQKSRGSAEKRKDRTVRRAVKSEPCCACGTKGTDWNPVDPAHIRTWKVTQSDHPANMIPLCRTCHQTQHKDGWKYFIIINPHVGLRLLNMGWEFAEDPFDAHRFIFTHPEVA